MDTAPPYPYLLAWAIPIMLTCPIHRCRLVSAADPTASYYEPPPNPAVTAMDTYTWQALTTGRVTLPGQTIPARVWCRLLRTIIDEITDLPADPDNMHAALQPAGAGVRPPVPNRTTGNPTKAWTATPKTEPCKPPQPSSPRYKTAPSPATAPQHTCSNPTTDSRP
jgi:hypothetical protein